MKPIIKRLELDKNKRIICVSDIHNELDLFQRLLEKVRFCDNDYLFIIGDFLEKGRSSKNLDALHFMMDLSKKDNVFLITGNSDYVWPMMSKTKRPHLYIDFLLKSDNSLVNELCELDKIEITCESNCYELADRLSKSHPIEWEFLNTLPQIMETNDYIFVHGGIYPDKPDYCDNFYQVMKFDNFEGTGFKFDKYVIVGHWPVSNYATEVMSFNPRINEKQHIISIDGGNVLKTSGQLNALIIDNGRFSWDSVDNLKEVEVLNDYTTTSNLTPFSINWNTAEIKILKRYDTYSHVYHYTSRQELDIPNEFIFEKDGKTMSDDITNVHLNVKKGDKVKLIDIGKDYSLVKKDGILGWVKNTAFISR